MKVAPATPRLIDRGDLLAALDRAVAGKVTIISAPAGSGKTSPLRAWADRPGQRHRIAVVQVQRDQQDAQLFWLALLHAVRHACGSASGAEPPAATPEFNGRAIVDRVLSALADHQGRVILVIDDLHGMNSTEALAQLTRLLTSLPPHVHAVLATRRDLRLHRLCLSGELAEIRAADLRFTRRETRELLEASGIALSEAGAALLYERTVLLDLEDANAFVVSLDPERTWFRYHHLFGDLLRLQVRGRGPRKCRCCAGGPPGGSPSMARWSTPSGTPRRRATARRGPAARRPFVQPDARRARANHPGAVAGLPAGSVRGSARAGPGARDG